MKNLIKKYYRWLAKWRLTHRYEYLIEVNTLLEEYVTQEILAGGSAEFIGKYRQDLITKQNEIKSHEKMVAFLKRTK